jgi:inosine/xanthosine triphosphatase
MRNLLPENAIGYRCRVIAKSLRCKMQICLCNRNTAHLDHFEFIAEMSRSIVVLAASTNPVKVKSVEVAFQRAHPGVTIKVLAIAAASDVPAQPMGFEETRQGARNRVNNALKDFQTASPGETAPDYVVGLEGGCVIETFAGSDKEMSCFAWMAVLETKTNTVSFARTGTFVLPKSVSDLVEAGIELGEADDRVFGRTNSKHQDGAVGLLTRGTIDRTEYYVHAIILALSRFLSAEYY